MSRASAFTGKRVLVTGGTSGIGRELAVALARTGAHVVATGTGERTLAALAADHPEIEGHGPDLTDDVSIRRLVETLRSRFGPLDLLVNNAGIQENGRFLPGPVAFAAIDREVAVNLTGPIKLTAALLPLMAAGGTVVNVSSGTAWTGKPDAAVYSAAKAGISVFGRALRRQLSGAGIAVVTVYPPVTRTAMTAGRSGAFADAQAVAARIVAGLARGEREIVIGRLRPLALANRLSPALAEAIVARQG